MKMKLASINLEGRTSSGHQNFVRFRPEAEVISWETYVADLKERFGEKHKDLMSKLLSLKQSGKVSDYYDQFDYWVGRVQISGEIALGIFLNGLKPAIQHHIRSFMPTFVNQAYTFAVLQETSFRTFQQELSSNSRRPLLLPTPRT